MTAIANVRLPRPQSLRAVAENLMTVPPLAFQLDTPIQKAAALLEHYAVAEAPVVNWAGRLQGVVTPLACADWREFSRRASSAPEAESVDLTPVAEIMSPRLTQVKAAAPACAVIEALLQDAAEQAYVVDDGHELIGVIRATDLLRHLAAADAGCLTKFGTSLAGC
jgi:CBS-domain-containing membrane protein